MKKIILLVTIMFSAPVFAADYVSMTRVPEALVPQMQAAISSGKYNCGVLTDAQCFDRELRRRALQILIDHKGDELRAAKKIEMDAFKAEIEAIASGE